MVSIRKQRFSALNSLLITLQAQLSVTTVCSQLSNPYSLLKALYSKLYSNFSTQISLPKFLNPNFSTQNSVLVSRSFVIPNKSQLTVIDWYESACFQKKSSLSIASFQNGVTEMEQFHTLWRPAKRCRCIRYVEYKNGESV